MGDSIKMNFIKVKDEETAEKLKNLNFQLIDFSDGIYTFLNNASFHFSNDIDVTKIKYSNMLCI